MIESIFVFESARSRQREAPLLEERKQYLSYLQREGFGVAGIRSVASMLLHIVRLMELTSSRIVDRKEIEEASHRWLKDTSHKMTHRGEPSVHLFTHAAINWLGFHNLINTAVSLD
jgi:integrase/recombinase XerD